MGLRIRKTSKFGRNSAVHGESTQAQSKRAILKMLGKHVTFFINRLIETPLTPDRPQVKKPPPSLQITSNFLVFYGLSHGATLKKKGVEQNLTYSKI